jgi:hypothetical protein
LKVNDNSYRLCVVGAKADVFAEADLRVNDLGEGYMVTPSVPSHFPECSVRRALGFQVEDVMRLHAGSSKISSGHVVFWIDLHRGVERLERWMCEVYEDTILVNASTTEDGDLRADRLGDLAEQVAYLMERDNAPVTWAAWLVPFAGEATRTTTFKARSVSEAYDHARGAFGDELVNIQRL